ncbi:hypothetical protein [Streptomyces sp. NPDC002490]|uniref:hypothetical protein n=1 Tax=Streptomyces sp. NPDC002490 TaxID=3154416 RepID=UPI003319D0A1
MNSAWEQPRSLPAMANPDDGTLVASLSLAAEVPPGLDPNKHRWQVNLAADNHPIPPHPALGSSAVISPDQNPWETFVRAADGGITYWSHRFDFVPSGASLAGSLASPKLAWPGIKRILKVASEQNGVEVVPSPAGKRSAITERLLGNRSDLEELAASPGWELLRLFTHETPQSLCPADSRWKLKSTVALSWEAIAEHKDTDWEAVARRRQIDQWTTQGVLRRGLILSCDHCPILEFYPISEINQKYNCRRCEGENNLTSERWRPATDEPRWFYDLHPAVLELVKNDGNVPLLATRHLRSERWARKALICEEFELLKNGTRFVEMDFALASTDHLWLGEAKINNSLGSNHREIKREVGKLLEGSSLVGATGLVLATTKTHWSRSTLDILKSETKGRLRGGKPTPNVHLLTGLGSAPQLAQLSP